MGKIACLFPGQGSQSPGMGQDLFANFEAAQQVFARVDQLCGRPLSKMCFEGPEEELKRTVNTQPAILAVSLAAWECYRAASGPLPQFVAGHSLGEFTALYAAGALTLSQVVPLVVKRAQLMEGCPAGAMAAVIGISGDELQFILSEAAAATGEVVIVANYNTREQLVISGSPDAVAKASDAARQQGAKVVPLAVGGAFHSPLMASAAREFADELARVDFADARLPVVQNFDAAPATASRELKLKLDRQMANSVRWCATVEFLLSAGVDTFIEIGPGKALAGMVKKIERSACVLNIYDEATLTAALDQLGCNVGAEGSCKASSRTV